MTTTAADHALGWSRGPVRALDRYWDVPPHLWALNTSGPTATVRHHLTGLPDPYALIRNATIRIATAAALGHDTGEHRTDALVLAYEAYALLDVAPDVYDPTRPVADQPGAQECRHVLSVDRNGRIASLNWVRGADAPTAVMHVDTDTTQTGPIVDALTAAWDTIAKVSRLRT